MPLLRHHERDRQDARADRILRIARNALLVVVVLTFAAVCFHGIANWWQYGHNGYNGAGYSNGARNSLRWGFIGPAVYHFGTTPATAKDIFTHHPILLNAHLALSFALFGFQEWAGRLVPALYNLGTLLLLWRLVRMTHGPGTALLTAVMFAFMPLTMIYANMIDHEQGVLFWLIALVHAHIAYIRTSATRWFVASLACVTLAMQWHWPGYYVAFFLAVHAAAVGLARREPGQRWRPEFTYVVVFSLVVLANAALFFGWIALLKGGMHEMASAFNQRTARPGGYLKRLWERGLVLHGPIQYALTAGWFVVFALKARQRRLHEGHLIPLVFLFAHVVHGSVFATAGNIHAYWVYPMAPFFAVAAGETLWEVGRAAGRLVERMSSRSPGHTAARGLVGAAVASLVAAPVVAAQARFGMDKLAWGFANGSGSFLDTYYDQFDEIMWARALAATFDRERTTWVVHPSVRDPRLEFFWYLDARIETSARLTPRASDHADGRQTVFLIDLERLDASPSTRKPLARLVEKYPVTVWNRRFVAIAVQDGSEPTVVAHQSVERDAPWYWSWFVNPNRPPIDWVADPASESVRLLLLDPRRPRHTERTKGTGGSPWEWVCPRPLFAQALSLETVKTSGGSVLLTSARPICRPAPSPAAAAAPNPPQAPAAAPASAADPASADPTRAPSAADDIELAGPRLGTEKGGGAVRSACADDEVAVGLHGRAGALVDAAALVCAPAPTTDTRPVPWPTTRDLPLVGGEGGTSFRFVCPAGEALGGLDARGGGMIDAIGIACVPYPNVERPEPARRANRPRVRPKPPVDVEADGAETAEDEKAPPSGEKAPPSGGKAAEAGQGERVAPDRPKRTGP